MSNTKPKIIGYVPLHYGAQFLDAAIRAVDPFLEKIYILYTKEPSYGFGTHLINPDTEEQLKSIAYAASNKIEWVEVKNCGQENHHRNRILEFATGYDGVFTFDADEIFEPEDMPRFLTECHISDKRYIGVDGYQNFWRSFNHVCLDGFRPIRYINLHNASGYGEAKCRVYHFSTAQRIEIMRYKLDIHGHKAEIRPNWLDGIYLSGQTQDVHLVALGLWNVVDFDKNSLPELLKSHPDFDKDIIS